MPEQDGLTLFYSWKTKFVLYTYKWWKFWFIICLECLHLYPALYHACNFGNIVNCCIILNFVFAASYKVIYNIFHILWMAALFQLNWYLQWEVANCMDHSCLLASPVFLSPLCNLCSLGALSELNTVIADEKGFLFLFLFFFSYLFLYSYLFLLLLLLLTDTLTRKKQARSLTRTIQVWLS